MTSTRTANSANDAGSERASHVSPSTLRSVGSDPRLVLIGRVERVINGAHIDGYTDRLHDFYNYGE
jgi:hypothetical protein